MLNQVFARHPDKSALLVLSDGNIFPNDKRGESLAVKHAQKFNANIYRFANPKYAEGSDARGGGLIEDVTDQDLQETPKPKFAKAVAVKPPDEDDLTEQLAQKVETQEKAEEAKKTGATTTGRKRTAGVKAKK